jgi:hypothetical protein
LHLRLTYQSVVDVGRHGFVAIERIRERAAAAVQPGHLGCAYCTIVKLHFVDRTSKVEPTAAIAAEGERIRAAD